MMGCALLFMMYSHAFLSQTPLQENIRSSLAFRTAKNFGMTLHFRTNHAKASEDHLHGARLVNGGIPFLFLATSRKKILTELLPDLKVEAEWS